MGNTLHEVSWLLLVDFGGCGKTDLETSKELLIAFGIAEGWDDGVCKHTSNLPREFCGQKELPELDTTDD